MRVVSARSSRAASSSSSSYASSQRPRQSSTSGEAVIGTAVFGLEFARSPDPMPHSRHGSASSARLLQQNAWAPTGSRASTATRSRSSSALLLDATGAAAPPSLQEGLVRRASTGGLASSAAGARSRVLQRRGEPLQHGVQRKGKVSWTLASPATRQASMRALLQGDSSAPLRPATRRSSCPERERTRSLSSPRSPHSTTVSKEKGGGREREGRV